ncbi:hypothetical protein CHLNCDRAFT_142485 [Chlorella variabilis]|uniref:Uncharacterized protein n=1 Tax=Chlorella variabilis TaxID=554065 RepID=E1ZTR3_CHLVA|nr:hypothetical protein CHLNCDRAFT_142485 [Chlorella variabilis]EFN50759.1 hypothetical protein CHLNCDRAFT_142485 [Chlorella variabilis]|eukprot:XP_005842871.1 hypothetical protein CHLNCDRAFT_142485 [Chlorella variabilis]
MVPLQGSWHPDHQPPRWGDVVAAAALVAPSLTSLTIRWDGAAVAGVWLLEAVHLQELALFCGQLTLTDALGSLAELKELSAESSDGPLTVQSAATLPPSLTKLYAVECRLAELPEAVSCLPHLESAYLSRNPLLPSSLTRLAGLPRLQLISLIGCSFERPPPELSAVTTLRVLYLDYNPFGIESEVPIQAGFSSALAPLMRLQALGLSHLLLESWPEVLSSLAKLQVLYLECNPGIARLPAAAAPVLARLRVLSCDCTVLFSNPGMLRQAALLEHLYVSGSGLMWHALLTPVEEVLEALAAMKALQKLTFVSEEVASVEVMQLMLQMGQRCPGLQVEALDSEQFFGVTLEALEPVE